jgi:hypothetical protein
MLSEISEAMRVKMPSEICLPGDLLPYTLRRITRKFCPAFGTAHANIHVYNVVVPLYYMCCADISSMCDTVLLQ